MATMLFAHASRVLFCFMVKLHARPTCIECSVEDCKPVEAGQQVSAQLRQVAGVVVAHSRHSALVDVVQLLQICQADGSPMGLAGSNG